MSVVFGVTFKAKEDQYDTLHKTLTAILPDTAARSGAELISCAANPGDKSFYIHEVWDKIESQQQYIKWREERGDTEKLVALLREPPEFKELELLAF